MSYVGSGNNVVSNGAGTYLFVLKSALLAAGWELVSNSSGTAIPAPANTDVLTSAALFGAANAWARLREPTFPGQFARREYILQNGTQNGTTALIKYSRATGFNTGGSGAVAPTTGTGGDGVLLVGNTVSGTDASPGTATGFANASGFVAAVADNTPSPGTYGGFSWYLLGYTAGAANIITCFTEAVAPGSTSSLDQDPMWRLGSGSTFGPVTPTTPSPSSLGGAYFANAWTGHSYWQAYGLTSPSYIRAGQLGLPICIAPTTAASKTIAYTAGFASVSPYDGREPMYPLLLGQAGVPSSSPSVPQSIPKGYTTGLVLFGATHNLLDTFNLNTADPKVAIALTANSLQSVAMPWLTNVVPAV
jgi:hypothetical protein